MDPHVVIVGGGFGGLYAARELAGRPVRVTVVDRSNHHLFQPLLYQVATAALSPGEIASPIRSIVRRARNVRVILGDVTGIDLEQRTIQLDDGDHMRYDHLILAAGSRHSYFGHDEWEPLAPGLKSIEDALEIRRRILLAYERAEREAVERESEGRSLPEEDLRAMLTIVIVGGGPTGVELAGAIAEIARHTLARNFRAIDPAKTRVLIIQGGDRILPSYPPSLSAKAAASLRDLGVEIRTDARVTNVTPEGVYIGDEFLPCGTVLWAAGVAPSPLARSLGTPLDRGLVVVEPDLTLPGHPEVQCIGDLALFTQGGTPLPGVAPVAIQQGRHAGRNVLRAVAGRPQVAFRYWDKGNLAIIGRGRGVADFGRGLHLDGLLAWLAWLFVHIFYLIGFENRLLVFLQWAWSYATYGRGARLITGRAADRRPEANR